MSLETHASPVGPSPRAVVLFVLASSAILALAFLSRFNGYRVYDSAYLYVRYADHLRAGHGMAWNVGEGSVYGVSSLAYLVAVIPFRLLFPDNPTLAIFASSFFWGLMFLALLFRLALKNMHPPASQKPYAMGLVMLALIASAISLRGHFASGMETMLVLAYLTWVLGLMEGLRLGPMDSKFKENRAWLAGAVLGMAWWVRPDLVIFTLGIPLIVALLAWIKTGDAASKVEASRWIKVAAMSLAGTGLCLVAAWLLTGAWLPQSYLVQRSWTFHPAFVAQLRAQPYNEASWFLGHHWPIMVVIGLGIFLKWGRLGQAYSTLDKGIALAVLAFGLYSSWGVLQVMGMGQRFYYPLFPFLLYLALREMQELETNLRIGHGLQFKRMPVIVERLGLVVVTGLLIYYGIDYGRNLRSAQPSDRLAEFDTERIYREGLQGYWAELDALQDLPGSLRIAATEVGMPAALHPDLAIDDLAGLNAPALWQDGLQASSVLAHCPADLIYFPHAQYALLNHSLSNSPEFAARYTTLPAKELGATLAVSIRKDSPYSQQLMAIFGN